MHLRFRYPRRSQVAPKVWNRGILTHQRLRRRFAMPARSTGSALLLLGCSDATAGVTRLDPSPLANPDTSEYPGSRPDLKRVARMYQRLDLTALNRPDKAD